MKTKALKLTLAMACLAFTLGSCGSNNGSTDQTGDTTITGEGNTQMDGTDTMMTDTAATGTAPGGGVGSDGIGTGADTLGTPAP